ncbi:SMC family ATPase [uncultured Williamsia sp.]|uniref:AAA family ATPase n=1 Tax=uncultured Williamsia sp. TaxID=259311 RepID=UPI00260D8F27|nr:SMC family ATPase [uncultured Williamsia sp.]
MRLHSVAVRAFGPFADEVVVDFDALGEDGLFLLHGQTGAGKTTVLDAVAFALFGRVPGVRHEGRRLHSDHAGPDVVPRVVLEATIAGRRMRIERSPEHHRPKSRGNGLRKIQAKGVLVWTDGSGPELTRLPEIGETVTRLLGMTADQFFQVVLLPQNDFARFLRADNEDRETLLEKLFDTERFGGVEEWLRDRARTTRAEVETMTQTTDRLAGQIAAIAGVDSPAEPDIAWATELLEAARTDATRARTEAETAALAADRAQGHLDDCARRDEKVRRADTARSEIAVLDADAALVDETCTVLDAARRAAGVRSALDDATDAAARRDALAGAVVTARTTLATTSEGADMVASVVDAPDATAVIDAAVDRWSAESGRLAPLVERAARRPAMVTELSSLAADTAHAERRSAAIAAELDEIPRRRAELATRISNATAAGATVSGLRAEVAAVTALIADATRRDALLTPLATARAESEAARAAHVAAREDLVDIRERRVANMAAELASRLAPGEPCPACGSPEHPAPAHLDGDTPPVTDADERTAQAAEEAAGDRARRGEIALTEIQADHDALCARLGEHTTSGLTAAASTARRAVADAERLAAELAALRAQADEMESSVTALTAEQGRLQADQSRRAERAQAVRTALRDLDAELDAARGTAESVDARRRALTDLSRAAVALRDATSRWRAAVERATAATDRAQEVAVDAGFVDVEAARSALADAAQIARWDSTLTQLAARRSAAQAVLDDADVAAAVAAGPVDLDAARATRDATRQVHDDAQRRAALTADRVDKLETHCAQFWAAVDHMAPACARADEVTGLADVVAGRGANNRSMSLRSYVLAARLEEVVVAASTRLREMSCGRYEFEHSDAARSHGRRGGLGIAIRDEYTGAVRPAATLSGGETFFASLALALGLADVVSAEAGGRVLDTMFIDEGFGSLDPETLERVMAVLDELRSGGRVVGVVSHVDEMRSRIPAQLHVVRTESGSRVELLGIAG